MSDLRAHAEAQRAAANEGISSAMATLHRLEDEMPDRKPRAT
ncbi:MAG TPA: hypothetical protein VF137_05720 [Candidatus Dormibacteraeota bacterium]